jgi:predicted dehydrogenase
MQRRTFIHTSALSAAVSSIGRAAPPKIKIGQIGLHHPHGKGKLATILRQSDTYDFVGLVPENPAEVKHVDYPVLVSTEQLLNTPGLQAVAVETRVEDLVSSALPCVQAGMHIHLDKPAGLKLKSFRALHAVAKQHGTTIQMGYMFRYNPAFQLTYKAAREGWLGNIFEIDGVISKFISNRARKQLEHFHGGFMFELACHLIDSAVYLLGKPDRVTPFIRRTYPEKDQLADNCLAVLEYPKATATIRTAAMEVEGQRRRQFVVCGDRGTADIHPLEKPVMKLALDRARGVYRKGYQELAFPSRGRYDGEFEDLARVIRGEGKLAWTPAHDLAVHETILRAADMPLD